MGYTIFIREQVTPRITPIRIYLDEMDCAPSALPPGYELDAEGKVFRWQDQPTPIPAPVYPATFRKLLYSYDPDIYSDDEHRRAELWQDDAGTATIAQIKAMFPRMVDNMCSYIKGIRVSALGTVPKNAGVLAVYDENYKAAVAIIEGRGSDVMKDGSTALDFMARFGSKFGMSAEQFAAYIIGENRRVNPTAVAIEERYLALCYGGDAATGLLPISALPTITAMRQAVIDYADFCGEGIPWGPREAYAEV
jgi:hypothetical protein